MTIPAISLLGISALLLEAPGDTDLATQRRIWALARDVAGWPETGEAVPGMNNLMLRFASPPRRLGFQALLMGRDGRRRVLASTPAKCSPKRAMRPPRSSD